VLDPRKLFPFPLDDFQLDAMEAIADNKNVIVCAPTGSGKTAIAEYALHRAVEGGRRCFYTTPLKALSNQKFQDFRNEFGEDRVGLLTGDLSVHRNANIVVMTTEVFRNMLYGTTLGEVERNLHGVQSVILDECHYMNDVERGTVWEESVIYAPHTIQLVALSATVANARDLCDWVSQIHAPTELITSDFRPVPLKHWFFHRRELQALFTKDKKLNPNLRRLIVPQSARRKEKKEDPSGPDQVVRALQARDMLPAIYFVFSRRGCENSMNNCRGAVRLKPHEADELGDAIEAFLKENPSLEGNPHLPHLFEGLAVHHAGLLPGWKALVEQLYQRGLIKVVFATETLAAGINMPARTTVISTISKYTGEGHRLLTASEFLQMSGRAGRRGMDELGHVVIVSHPKESIQAAAHLARSPADPLESNFRPSYGMVLNLLQNHTMNQCRDLVEKSFGQFLADRGDEDFQAERRELTARLDRLSEPLCPGPLGDLPHYRKLIDKNQALLRQARNLSGVRQGPPVRREIERLKAERDQVRGLFQASPCHNCPEQQPCSAQGQERANLERRLRGIDRASGGGYTPYWRQFIALVRVLEHFGYLHQNKPTPQGELAGYLRATNVVLLAEVARSGCLERLDAVQTAAVLTALVTDESRSAEHVRFTPSGPVQAALEEAYHIAEDVFRVQNRHQVDVAVLIQPVYSNLTERWAQGAHWDMLLAQSGMEAGDLIRALRRTLDICRQLAWAPGVSRRVAAACKEAEGLISRDEVRESLLVTDVGLVVE